MKFQVGDVVRYLNAVGGGVVKRIINANLVEIIDESGFELPVNERELVLIEHKEQQKQTVEIQTPVYVESQCEIDESSDYDEIEGNDSPHLFLAFVRNSKQTNSFDTYIINDSNFNTLFVLTKENDSSAVRIASGLLEMNSKIFVTNIPFEKLSDFSKMHLSGVFYKQKEFIRQHNVDAEIELNLVKFYKPGVFVVNDFFDEDAYVLDMYDASKVKEDSENSVLQSVEPQKIKEALLEKHDLDKPSTEVPQKPEKIKEIDLHILELVDDDSKMSPFEKLELQLKTFERELTTAISEGYEKIVFIHGVGQGILKAKIRGRLDKDYPQFFYQDASFQKYKFGATLVYLRKTHK